MVCPRCGLPSSELGLRPNKHKAVHLEGSIQRPARFSFMTRFRELVPVHHPRVRSGQQVKPGERESKGQSIKNVRAVAVYTGQVRSGLT